MRERGRRITLGGLIAISCAATGTAAIGGEASDRCGSLVLPANVTAAVPAAVDSMHPVLMSATFANATASMLLFRPLLWFGSGGQIDWANSLASAVKPSADGTRVTVTLRPWHWSDGTAVTSADVLYTWSLIGKVGPAYSNYGVGGVPGLIRAVTAPDPHTVVIDLTGPVNTSWFIRTGLTDFLPLPSRWWSRNTVTAQQSMQSEASFYQVVDGPYRLQSLALGRQAVFIANDRYDGHHPPTPRLVDDFQQGIDPLEALRSGQLDAAYLPFELWSAASHVKDVRRITLHGTGVINGIMLNLRNPRVPFLDEVAVRQAIARAIDQTRIIDVVFHGQSMRQEGFVATEFADQIPPELRGGGGPLSYDPTAARALLANAGWHPGRDGIRVRNGQTLTFSVLTASGAEAGVMLLEMVAADLARVGIRMTIREVEFNQEMARVVGPHDGWDATYFGFTSGPYPDGSNWFSKDSQQNNGGFSDPIMEQLLRRASTEPGNAAAWAVERYALLQQPIIFLPDGFPTILVRSGIGNVERLAGPNGQFAPENLTIDAAAGRCGAPPHA